MTMNYIYGLQFEGQGLFAKWMHLAHWLLEVCQAVRNRKDMLKRLITGAISSIEASGEGVWICSIGSGPGQEIYELLENRGLFADRKVNFLLFDVDDEALSSCYTRLKAQLKKQRLEKNVKLYHLYDSARNLLAERHILDAYPDFHMVYSAGLFDYLKLQHAQALTLKLFHKLRPGGRLYIGNFTERNPQRWYMEHLTAWYLKYRTLEEIKDFAALVPPGVPKQVLEEDQILVVLLGLINE